MKRVRTFNGIVLALLVPFSIYNVARGFTLATVLIILSVLLSINVLGASVSLRRREIMLFISIMILGILSLILNSTEIWYNSTLYIHNQFSICISFAALIILTNCSDIKSFIYSSIVLSVIASLICLYQAFSIFLFGSFKANFYLPFWAVIRDVDTISGLRPCAFFTEPAHLCMYLAPVLYFLLSKHKYIVSILLLAALLVSSSTTGLLLCAIIPSLFFYYNGLQVKRLLLIVAIFYFFYKSLMIYYPSLLEFAFSKLEETDASSDLRLLGPLVYLPFFDLSHYMFGIGLNQMESFILYRRGSLAFEGSGNYANSMLYMFFSYGITGLIILVTYLYQKHMMCTHSGAYMVILITILCTDQIIFSTSLVYLLSFLCFSRKLNDLDYTDKTNKLLCLLK